MQTKIILERKKIFEYDSHKVKC